MGYGVYGKMWLKSTVLLFWSTVSILRFLSLCPTPRQCLCRTMVSHVSLICFFFSLMLKNREKKKSILLFILIFKQSEAKYIERCYMCDEFRCVTLEFLVLFWYNLHLGSDHSLLSVLLCASGKYTLVKVLFCTMRVQCFLAGVGAQGEKISCLGFPCGLWWVYEVVQVPEWKASKEQI